MIETFAHALPADLHEKIIQVMQDTCTRQKTLALAESCTGGLVAAVLTDVEGCAHGFDRGFTTYSDDAKRELLGIDA